MAVRAIAVCCDRELRHTISDGFSIVGYGKGATLYHGSVS